MALVVGSATVATGMSPVVEGGLYADEIFRMVLLLHLSMM